MASQFTIPLDLEVPLKRLLVDLASAVDVLVEQSEVVADTVVVTEDVVEEDTSEAVSPFEHVELAAATYKDFNNVAWGALVGVSKFTALGSTLVNPPFVPVPATTYIFYIESYSIASGGIVQRLLTEVTGASLTAHYRTGSPFATAVTNGWTAL